MSNFNNPKLEYYLHGIFEFGVFTKGFNGIWETVSGILILISGKPIFAHLFSSLTRKELVEDPHDRFIDYIIWVMQNIPANAKKFAAIYILIHGILNIFLAIQLQRKRLWAYLITIGANIIFIIYQIHRISLYHSRILTLVTVWDLLFIILAWHEYKHQKNLNI